MSKFLRVSSLAIGVAALVFLCWRFGLSEVIAAVSRVRPGYLLLYLGVGCAVRIGYALRWRLVARALGTNLALGRLVAARLAGDAAGSLLPAGRIGGDPVRIALVYGGGLGGAEASAGVAIDRIMEVIGNSVSAVVYVTVFAVAHTSDSARAAGILIATLLLALAALVVPLETMRRGMTPLGPLYGWAKRHGSPRVLQGAESLQRVEAHVVRLLREDLLTFTRGVGASLLIDGVVIIEYYFLLAAFGVRVALPTLLMVLVATGLARVVPTPGGLGAIEASEVTVLAVAAGRPDVGFVIGILVRLHETLWGAIGLVVLSLQGVSLARVRLLAVGGKAA